MKFHIPTASEIKSHMPTALNIKSHLHLPTTSELKSHLHLPTTSEIKSHLPSFWRFHQHSSTCDCCPTDRPSVVVKRRRSSVITPGARLAPPTPAPVVEEPVPEQSPIDIREKETDVVRLQQSPIDIHENETDHIPMGACTNAVKISMGESDAEIDYDGHGIHIVWSTPGGNTLTIDGKVYHAVQFHFHTPSEHTLDGAHEELELHLVHTSEDGGFAVLGVLIREGKENPFLSQFWDKLAYIKHDVPTKIPVGAINPQDLGIAASSFFRYRGSLTTPPYTEGVEWVVIHDVMEASREQLDAFHRALPGTNARDVQPLNHRHIAFAC